MNPLIFKRFTFANHIGECLLTTLTSSNFGWDVWMFSDEICFLHDLRNDWVVSCPSYCTPVETVSSTFFHLFHLMKHVETQIENSRYKCPSICEPCCFPRNHLCSLAVAMQQFIHSACQQGTEGTMTHAVTLLATVMFNTWEGYSLACREIWFPPVPNTRLSHFELRSNWLLLVLNFNPEACCRLLWIQTFIFLWSLDFLNRVSLCTVFFVLFNRTFFCFETLTNLCCFVFYQFSDPMQQILLAGLQPPSHLFLFMADFLHVGRNQFGRKKHLQRVVISELQNLFNIQTLGIGNGP